MNKGISPLRNSCSSLLILQIEKDIGMQNLNRAVKCMANISIITQVKRAEQDN